MTLLKCDGFEGYGRAYLGNFWPGSYCDTEAYIGAQGRRSGNCVYSTSYNNFADFRIRYIPEDPTDVIIMGWAYKNTGSLPSNRNIFEMWNLGSGADPGIRISSNGGMSFTAYRQYGFNYQYAVLANFTLEYNNWYYFEIKCESHTTTGQCTLRIDEQEIFSVSNVDTVVQSGQNGMAHMNIINETYCYGHVDDVYVLNTEGTLNNNFLGDIRVDVIHPNGAGNYAQLTPSTGDNYECINETSFDNTDYVESAVDQQKDSYAYPNVPTDLDDTAIYGVQLDNVCKRTAESANREVKGFLRTGSTDYEDAAAQSLLDNHRSKNSVWEQDPSDSNNWTQAKINACEFGVEVN